MKKHLSVLALHSRLTVYKIATLIGLTAVLQGVLFALCMSRGEWLLFEQGVGTRGVKWGTGGGCGGGGGIAGRGMQRKTQQLLHLARLERWSAPTLLIIMAHHPMQVLACDFLLRQRDGNLGADIGGALNSQHAIAHLHQALAHIFNADVAAAILLGLIRVEADTIILHAQLDTIGVILGGDGDGATFFSLTDTIGQIFRQVLLL